VDTILVDDFEVGATQGVFSERKNRLDAFQGTWARRPSYTVITKVPDTRPGSKGYALRIEFNKSGGWCGWYTLLNGIDVSRHNALTFWVKGEKGGERFDIGFADARMQDLEIDAVYAGPILAFLPDGVTTDWQKVKVPLAGLKTDLDMTRMGSLVFWFRYEGSGAIHLDDVAFVYDEEVERIQRENIPKAEPHPKSPRAMWIWKSNPIEHLDVRREMLSFAKKAAMRRFYIYLGEDPITHTPPQYQAGLADFLKECHTQGIEVHALQGNPLWALKPYHARVLEWIEGFLAFNRGRPLEERIDGIHMDIEPYLTQEWETGDRDQLKAEFLDLMRQCRALIDKEAAKLGEISARPWATGMHANKPFVMGLAIPLFYEREPELEEKLLAFVDYAALMDYYDNARDIIAHGSSHLEMANRLGVEMVIGVETQDLVEMHQGTRRNTFIEEGWQEMERELKKVVEAFLDFPSFGGIAIHHYDSYRLMQKGRNVPTRERSGKVPVLKAKRIEPGAMRVDGDLADWQEADWIALNRKEQVVYGAGAWEGAHDLSGRLAFAWEPEALWMAIDVTDNIHIQEKRGADMWEGDHLELWIDADLWGDYQEAVNSADDFQLGLSPGNFRDLPYEVHVWVPAIAPESVQAIQYVAKPKPNGYGYTMELKIPTSFLFQNIPKRIGIDPTEVHIPKGVTHEQWGLHRRVLESGKMEAGFQLGVMADLSDCDDTRHPQKCLISPSPERQWGDPTTFNPLQLE